MGFDKLWLNGDGSAEMVESFLGVVRRKPIHREPIGREQRDAQVVVRLRRVGLDAKGFAEVVDRLGCLTLGEQSVG